MKTAKKYPSGWWLDCPSCGEGITDPDSGSLVHEAGSVSSGSVVTCQGCGEKCKIPKLPSKGSL